MAGCIDLVVGRGALDLKNNAGLNDESFANFSLAQLENAAELAFTLGISTKDALTALSDVNNANSVISNSRVKAS